MGQMLPAELVLAACSVSGLRLPLRVRSALRRLDERVRTQPVPDGTRLVTAQKDVAAWIRTEFPGPHVHIGYTELRQEG